MSRHTHIPVSARLGRKACTPAVVTGSADSASSAARKQRGQTSRVARPVGLATRFHANGSAHGGSEQPPAAGLLRQGQRRSTGATRRAWPLVETARISRAPAEPTALTRAPSNVLQLPPPPDPLGIQRRGLCLGRGSPPILHLTLVLSLTGVHGQKYKD